MREGSWDECIEENLAVNVTPNKSKTKSLVETAIGRIKFLEESQIKESNANYIFEGYYSSALELLHAFVLARGFKADNHICLGYFLRDVLRDDYIFRLFDDCRFKRNSLVYYGKQMEFETAKQAIKKCTQLISRLETLLGDMEKVYKK